MSKTCTKCKKTKKTLEFGKHKSDKNGLSSWCKKCHALWSQKRRQTEKGKRDHERGNEKYRNSKKGKEASTRGNKKHNLLHPNRKKARQIAANAIRSGRLIKEPCPCGKTKVQGHHEDYSKPLDVEWLCTKCHGKLRKRKD